MDLSQMTEAQFMCEENLDRAVAAMYPTPAEMAGMILDSGAESFSRLGTVRKCGQYRIVALGSTDVGLLDETDTLVGYYIGTTLALEQCVKGKGLSVPLILEAASNREAPNKRSVSPAGEAALRKAWRVANGHEENPWWP